MIYFVRHGQTDYNSNKLYAGQKDVPLNKEGVKQAKQTAEQLKDLKFDICFCSPLLRAKQTLNEILNLNKYKFLVVYDDRLKERDYGKLVDKKVGSIPFNRWKIGVDEDITQFYQIEQIKDMFARLKSFYDEVLTKYKNKNILIVAHSGVARVSDVYFNGLPKDNDLHHMEISNAQIIKFSTKNL